MRIIRDYTFMDPSDRGAAVAIGNFDGVHLGHQAVIDKVRSIKGDAPLGILTFEPHPREYFAPDAPPFRLMSAETKANRLEKLGVEKLFQLNFNAALSALTAEEFAKDVLHEALGFSHVVVGSDFCFGKDRAGDVALLKKYGEKLGYEVTVAELLRDDSKVFSSSAIRAALAEGDPQEAARMLGHLHRIDGEVIHGDQRGRTLGYPTANISIDGIQPPKYGVYAVTVDVLDGPNQDRYFGAASIGERPTFGVYKPNLEVFLFDFSADIYGANISVALVDYQRPELKFDDLDALIKQMDEDCVQARKTLVALYGDTPAT